MPHFLIIDDETQCFIVAGVGIDNNDDRLKNDSRNDGRNKGGNEDVNDDPEIFERNLILFYKQII